MKWYLLNFKLFVLCLGPQEDTWSLVTMHWKTCVFLSVNSRERIMLSGAVNAQETIPPHFPTELCLQAHKWLPLGTGSHPQEGKRKLEKYLYHWHEKALEIITGPQKDQPKAIAFSPGNGGIANLAGVSAPVPRNFIKVWSVKCSNKRQHLAWLHQAPIWGP